MSPLQIAPRDSKRREMYWFHTWRGITNQLAHIRGKNAGYDSKKAEEAKLLEDKVFGWLMALVFLETAAKRSMDR